MIRKIVFIVIGVNSFINMISCQIVNDSLDISIDYMAIIEKNLFSNTENPYFVLHQEAGISELMNKYIRLSNSKGKVYGYRVQLFFESGTEAYENAHKTKQKFEELYPEVLCYLVYEQPFFKIRAGNFRNIYEAEGLKQRVRKEFHAAFIVNDFITPQY